MICRCINSLASIEKAIAGATVEGSPAFAYYELGGEIEKTPPIRAGASRLLLRKMGFGIADITVYGSTSGLRPQDGVMK